ncbi:hypothetical protein ES702_06512 [subsurface metagenome]
MNVSGIWDGIAFLLKAPCHNILQLAPSGGTADLTFSSNNVSSGYIDRWSENSSVQVTTTVWANANANYTVKVDGAEISGSPFDSGDSGEVSFTRTGQGTSEEFRLIPPDICPTCQKYWAPLSCDYKIISNLTGGGDTNDNNANVYPTEICDNGIDDDSDDLIDCADASDCEGVKCDLCTVCSGGTCSVAAVDDDACGTIDCSSWYVQTGTEGAASTEYCYNKQDITTNRCEGINDCKDANTSDCDSQSNGTEQYYCGTCGYISSSNCTGTTLGSCSYYSSSTQGPTADYYFASDSASPTGTNYCKHRDYHCTGTSAAETYDDSTVATCGYCKYATGACTSCTNYSDKTACGGTYAGCSGGTCYENYSNGHYWAFKETDSYGTGVEYAAANTKCANLVENGWSDWKLPSATGGEVCSAWSGTPYCPTNPFTPGDIWTSTSLTPGWHHLWRKSYNNCVYGQGFHELPDTGYNAGWRCIRDG